MKLKRQMETSLAKHLTIIICNRIFDHKRYCVSSYLYVKILKMTAAGFFKKKKTFIKIFIFDLNDYFYIIYCLKERFCYWNL